MIVENTINQYPYIMSLNDDLRTLYHCSDVVTITIGECCPNKNWSDASPRALIPVVFAARLLVIGDRSVVEVAQICALASCENTINQYPHHVSLK